MYEFFLNKKLRKYNCELIPQQTSAPSAVIADFLSPHSEPLFARQGLKKGAQHLFCETK